MINKKNLFLTIFLFLFLFNIELVISSVIDSSILFFNKIFVSIFPFIILSDILIHYDYHIFLSKCFGNILSKLFNIDKNSTIVFILSILTSQPSNSIYIKNLLDNNLIDERSITKLLSFTYFPSIAFVLSIGITMYNSINIGVYLLLLNYLCNFLIGIFLRKEKISNTHNLINKCKKSFFIMLKESILKSFNTCLIILGNIIIFTIAINLITHYINYNQILTTLLSGTIELTSGINEISILTIPLKYKFILTSFILNFSGLSIIFQSKSILSNYKVNIKKILILKLVFSVITSILAWICTC